MSTVNKTDYHWRNPSSIISKKSKAIHTSADLNVIKATMLEELKENEGVERQPEFESIAFRAGWMTIYCSNESTAEWVRLNFGGIKDKSGLKIALVEQSEFPKTFVVNG